MGMAGRLFFSLMIASGLFVLVVAGSLFAGERDHLAQAMQPRLTVAVAEPEDADAPPRPPGAAFAPSTSDRPSDDAERWGGFAPPSARVTMDERRVDREEP